MIKENKTYSRRDDMSIDRSLNVFVEGDGDVCVFIGTDSFGAMRTEEGHASVEFVAMAGGMRSPHTRKALFDLIEAIQKDNKENPIPCGDKK